MGEHVNVLEVVEVVPEQVGNGVVGVALVVGGEEDAGSALGVEEDKVAEEFVAHPELAGVGTQVRLDQVGSKAGHRAVGWHRVIENSVLLFWSENYSSNWEWY